MIKSVWALLLVVLMLGGCASNSIYRERVEGGPCLFEDKDDVQCAKASVLSNPSKGYMMAFIEVDDQGVMHEPKQVEQALNMVKAGARNYVVVHVHGWHNNSAYTSHQVRRFHDRLEYAKRLYPEMNVVGIYVGWRGDSIEIPGLNKITFWDRKNASEEVGRNALPTFFYRLEARVNEAKDSTLLTVGHSFGASVVYNAIHHLMLERLVKSGDEVVRGYGDLVVLINPAIEAMRFASLRDAAQTHQKRHPFRKDQGPVLVVAASEGDWAASMAFPAGRFFSTLLEGHRPFQPPHRRLSTHENAWLSQREMDIQAIGHYAPYTTHRVAAVEPISERVCPDNKGWIRKAVERESVTAKGGSAGERWNTHWVDGKRSKLLDNTMGMQIWHTGRSSPYDPYWIVSAHANIVPDHSSINSRNFWCFVEMTLREAGGFKQLRPAPVAMPEAEVLQQVIEVTEPEDRVTEPEKDRP